MKTLYKEILFSSLLFITASVVTTIIHEGGHAFFVKYYSLQGQWYYDHVDWNYQTASTKQVAVICLGGVYFQSYSTSDLLPHCIKTE
jgi:hypothetical protein